MKPDKCILDLIGNKKVIATIGLNGRKTDLQTDIVYLLIENYIQNR